MILIEDSRNQFKTSSFSNYKKREVSKNLILAIYYGKQEETFFWTFEMLCSNMLLELWNSYFILMSKYIHVYNPRLPLYIMKKYNDFREIAMKYENDFRLRNDSNIRMLFGTISLILCFSQKFTILDDIVYKFNFQIENLYENLKAPHIKYIDFVYLQSDPKEFIIPYNELIYHLQETEQKTNIHFWINWIIQYDILCRKKKKVILCQQRDLFMDKNDKLSKNIIWIIWDILLKMSKKQSHSDINRIIHALFDLFTIKYTLSCNKSRIHIIYHSIELLLLKNRVDFSVELLKQKEMLTSLEDNIQVIFEQIKKHEVNVIDDSKMTKQEKKFDLYKNIYNNLST